MCDCYAHPCKECGKGHEVHLADFNTNRDEIDVYCAECFDRSKIFPWVLFKTEDGEVDKFAIVYKTDNAWENKNGNTPNACNITVLNKKGMVGR